MTGNIPEFKIGLTEEAINHLEKISKWASVLSILGFIYFALIILLGFISAFVTSPLGGKSGMGGAPSVLIAILYLLIALIYFFPILYLYKFSVYAKQSLRISSTPEFTVALKYLRNHYSYIGVLAIVAIALVVFGIVIAVFISLLR